MKKGILKTLCGLMAALMLLVFAGTPVTTQAAKLPYYIKINRQQNCVTVYALDSKGKYTKPIFFQQTVRNSIDKHPDIISHPDRNIFDSGKIPLAYTYGRCVRTVLQPYSRWCAVPLCFLQFTGPEQAGIQFL